MQFVQQPLSGLDQRDIARFPTVLLDERPAVRSSIGTTPKSSQCLIQNVADEHSNEGREYFVEFISKLESAEVGHETFLYRIFHILSGSRNGTTFVTDLKGSFLRIRSVVARATVA